MEECSKQDVETDASETMSVTSVGSSVDQAGSRSIQSSATSSAPSSPSPAAPPQPPPLRHRSSRHSQNKEPLPSDADVAACPNRPGIIWKAGYRIEAKDFMDKGHMKLRQEDNALKGREKKPMEDWYPARIVDIDYAEKSVLVHFDGWSQRFDQWVQMDSERIRPLTRHSERKEKRKKNAPKTEHHVGDHVFAKWTDCRMYPALIIGINDSDPQNALVNACSYEVLFYDGFKKTVQAINVRCMPSNVQKQYATAGLLPEPGKKSKQKVRELMDSVQPPSLATHLTKQSAASTSRKQSTPGSAESAASSKSNKRRLSVGAASKPSKKAKADPEDDTNERSAAGKTQKTKGKDVKRKRNSTDGKFVCEVKLEKSEAAELSIKNDPRLDKNDSSLEDTAMISSVVKREPMPEVEEHAKRIEDEGESGERLSTETAGEPSASAHPGPSDTADGRLQTTEHLALLGGFMGARAPKEFRVEDDHNKHKCPFPDCTKAFRKVSLLESHVKYYHQEGGTQGTPTHSTQAPPPVASQGPASSTTQGLLPPRKRTKTNSMCSTDSEISVGGGVRAGGSRQRWPSTSLVSVGGPEEEEDEEEEEEERGVEVTSLHDTTEVRTVASEDNDLEVSEYTEDLLRSDDVVSCICQLNEENGLMIQCDYCLCWQHAMCMDITEETLPKKYVCYVCCNPPGVRESQRYRCDQDWLKAGTMARFDMLLADPTAQRKAQIMEATHTLVGDMLGVQQVLASTRCQLSLLKNKDRRELALWSTEPRDGEVREASDLPPQSQYSHPEPHSNSQASLREETQETLFKPEQDDTVRGTENCATVSSRDMSDTEQKESLSLPGDTESRTENVELDSSGTETASNMSALMASEEENCQEEVVDESSLSGELSLLDHVLRSQDEAEHRLELIEEQVALLESEDSGNRQGDHILRDLPRVKKAMHQLLHDLGKVRQMALHH